MASTPKRRKIEPNGNIPSSSARIDNVATSVCGSPVSVTQVGRMDMKVQQAKKFAVTQAQQEGCTGNFRSFDSPYGNYLVPVIPTRADLFGLEDGVGLMKSTEGVGEKKVTKARSS